MAYARWAASQGGGHLSASPGEIRPPDHDGGSTPCSRRCHVRSARCAALDNRTGSRRLFSERAALAPDQLAAAQLGTALAMSGDPRGEQFESHSPLAEVREAHYSLGLIWHQWTKPRGHRSLRRGRDDPAYSEPGCSWLTIRASAAPESLRNAKRPSGSTPCRARLAAARLSQADRRGAAGIRRGARIFPDRRIRGGVEQPLRGQIRQLVS